MYTTLHSRLGAEEDNTTLSQDRQNQSLYQQVIHNTIEDNKQVDNNVKEDNHSVTSDGTSKSLQLSRQFHSSCPSTSTIN